MTICQTIMRNAASQFRATGNHSATASAAMDLFTRNMGRSAHDILHQQKEMAMAVTAETVAITMFMVANGSTLGAATIASLGLNIALPIAIASLILTIDKGGKECRKEETATDVHSW